VGDEYKIPGQVAAAGDHADVHGNKFNQLTNTKSSQVTNQGHDNIAISDVEGGNITLNINQTPAFIPSALHQLPPPSGDFVGREKEIKELLQALETGGIAISGLQGLGGVGKTTLALKLAEKLKTKYPDAQFYLDLKGASKQPLSATDAMAHVIRAYHPTAQLPTEENSLRPIYLSVLEGKKALLLMDNAANREQVKPLIPPAGSIMLVTSRNYFTLGGFFVKRLDMLEPQDAKKLLIKIAPRIDKCAAKIAELCGYLPLALEVAANTFHISVSLTPEDYVKRFSDTKKRLKILDEVTASLSLSYDLLTDEMQKLWRVLSVFPTTFDAAAVAALWEMEVEEATDNLDKLISYSLVEWSEATRRYRLHDLLRSFADHQLSEAERYSVKLAHASYFYNLLVQTRKLYFNGSQELLRGLSLFDKERENIAAGQRWAAALIDKDDKATKLSMDYYNYGWDVLNLRLHSREKLLWAEVSLKAARLLKHKQKEGDALNNLGLAYADLGEMHKAIEFYEQALLIDREIGNQEGESKVFNNLGIAYKNVGEPRKAIEFYEQYLKITRQIGDRRGEGIALGNLGSAYANLDETRKAIELYEQALLINREIGYRKGEGINLGNLGLVYNNLGQTHKAIEFYEQALLIDREIGYRKGEGFVLWNSAVAHKELGNHALAISLAEQALPIYEQVEASGVTEKRATLDSWKEKQKKGRKGEREKG
jgi:tetratricopeptide (TPR) repeat protein